MHFHTLAYLSPVHHRKTIFRKPISAPACKVLCIAFLAPVHHRKTYFCTSLKCYVLLFWRPCTTGYLCYNGCEAIGAMTKTASSPLCLFASTLHMLGSTAHRYVYVCMDIYIYAIFIDCACTLPRGYYLSVCMHWPFGIPNLQS